MIHEQTPDVASPIIEPPVIDNSGEEPGQQQRGVPWGLGELLAGSMIVVVGLFIASWIAFEFSGTKHKTQSQFPMPYVLAIVIFQNALMIGVSLFQAGSRPRNTVRFLGLSTDSWGPMILLGFGFGFIIFFAGEAVVSFSITLLHHVGFTNHDLQQISSRSSKGVIITLLRQSPFMVAFTVLVIVVIAPIGEEIFFRGFVHQGLKTHMSTSLAAVLSSALFASVHMSPIEFPALFVLGLCLVWLFERTGSLVAPIMAHGINNAISTAIVFLVGGQIS